MDVPRPTAAPPGRLVRLGVVDTGLEEIADAGRVTVRIERTA